MVGSDGAELVSAASEGDIEKVKMLLAKGVDVNALSKYGSTALMQGARQGYPSIVKLLIEKGANVTIKEGDYTAMRFAVSEFTVVLQQCFTTGSVKLDHYGEILELLIKNGADVNECNYGGFSLLSVVAEYGYPRKILELLLENGADVNMKCSRGYTALMLAAHKGRYEVIRMLIDNGADIDARNDEGKAALTLALTSPESNRGTIDMLRQAKSETVDFSTICDLIKNGNISDLKRMINDGISVIKVDSDKNSLLHIAAEIGNIEIVKLLVDKGVQVDHCNYLNHTALYRAATEGHMEVVKYLCEKGASTHGPTLMSPLAGAVSSGHLEIVKYLVEQMKVPFNSLERPFNVTPLHVAASFLKLDIVRYLMGRGANPDIPDKHGETAIGCVQKIKYNRDDNKISLNDAQLINNILACLTGNNKWWKFWSRRKAKKTI